VRTGGNTSCVELRTGSGAVVVLDAGTGIRPLGLALAAEGIREVDLLLTHLHLDHLEGLGFFIPLWDPACTIRIWGPRADVPLQERIAAYLSPPLFPIPFASIPAQLRFEELWEDELEIGGVTVRSAPVSHPGPTLGYRVTDGGRVLTFIPDNEPALDRSSGVELARGAGLLIHDAQYTDEEYLTRSGWGHSGLSDFARLVRDAAPERVLMFHHEPAHPDEELDAMEATAGLLLDGTDVRLAREGAEFELA
jgi:phosphoribosyl 1,2-cyclic phosphodiesterase